MDVLNSSTDSTTFLTFLIELLSHRHQPFLLIYSDYIDTVGTIDDVANCAQ